MADNGRLGLAGTVDGRWHRDRKGGEKGRRWRGKRWEEKVKRWKGEMTKGEGIEAGDGKVDKGEGKRKAIPIKGDDIGEWGWLISTLDQVPFRCFR